MFVSDKYYEWYIKILLYNNWMWNFWVVLCFVCGMYFVVFYNIISWIILFYYIKPYHSHSVVLSHNLNKQQKILIGSILIDFSCNELLVLDVNWNGIVRLIIVTERQRWNQNMSCTVVNHRQHKEDVIFTLLLILDTSKLKLQKPI